MTESLPAPLDVRIMNLTASVLFLVGGAMVLAAAAWWAVRNPVFAIAGITVQGELAHNSAVTLRANVTPRLAGNFFTLDLARAKSAFETVPWVRQAVVRREFPNRLRVLLQEHQPVAHWGHESESKLLNSQGEVFEANGGDVEQDELPRFAGPAGQSAEILAMYRALQPLFEPVDAVIEQLALSGRGGWRAELDSGAVIELGRGTPAEVAVRTQRFLSTLTQVTSRYGRTAESLVSADLRHADGYALRLRGVSTVSADPQKK